MRRRFPLGIALSLLLPLGTAAAAETLVFEGVGKTASTFAFVDNPDGTASPNATLAQSVGDLLAGAHFQVGDMTQGVVLVMQSGKLVPYFGFTQAHNADFTLVVGHAKLQNGLVVNLTLNRSPNDKTQVYAEGYFDLPADPSTKTPSATVYFLEPLTVPAPSTTPTPTPAPTPAPRQ